MHATPVTRYHDADRVVEVSMSATKPSPADALLDAVRDELSRHDPEVAQRILDALIEHDRGSDDLDETVWGPPPPLADVAEAEVATVRLLDVARQEVLADTLTRGEAAERLGVGPQHVSRLVDDGDLVALYEQGQLRLPGWQFHPDTPRGRLEGIRETVAALVMGPVEATQWAVRPNPALGGSTPAEALRHGDLDGVLVAARSGS
jgi:hypothetical protein